MFNYDSHEIEVLNKKMVFSELLPMMLVTTWFKCDMSTRSGETKMPTSTSSSKIPIPKSSLSSSKLDQDFIINSPPTSKIPVLKNVKSPVHENK